MPTIRKALGISGLMLAGLILSQSDCDSSSPMANNDLAATPDMTTTVPPDMTVLPDMTMFPAPTVTSVAPAAGANNATTALTITGTGFRQGATVTVGGQPCASVAVTSATTLTCTAPARAAFCGAQDIVVKHPDDGKQGTGSKLFRYRSATFGFAATSTTSTVSTGPNEILAVDLNNDGKLDLVNTNRTGNAVTSMLGGGDGTFMTFKSFTTGVNPVGLAAGDMNGDGKIDLVTANFGSGADSISYFAGVGDGTFAAKVDTSVGGGTFPHGVVLADVNGDKNLDALVALNGSAAVAVRLGNGSGGFLANPPANVGVGNNPTFIATGDLDGDGDLDMAVSCPGGNSVHVRLNNGAGVFSGTTNIAVSTNPGKLVLADLDGDSKLDLAVTSQNNNLISVYPGNGNGTFGATAMTTAVGGNPIGIVAADVDGDGKLDLFTANFGAGNATLLLGKGNGTFNMATGSPFTVGTQPFGGVLADLNNDGQPDYATANSGSANVTSRLQSCQ